MGSLDEIDLNALRVRFYSYFLTSREPLVLGVVAKGVVGDGPEVPLFCRELSDVLRFWLFRPPPPSLKFIPGFMKELLADRQKWLEVVGIVAGSGGNLRADRSRRERDVWTSLQGMDRLPLCHNSTHQH